MLLGEGSFHQVHGGVATNTPWASHPFDTFHAEYRAIRGCAYESPTRQACYLGELPYQALPFLAHSVAAAIANH